MRRFLRENSLSLFFGFILLLSLGFEALVGWQDFNNDQLAHHSHQISFGRYVTSSSFGTDVLENWQSEYLQFTLFILATIWLVQRGSPESKELGKEGRESEREQRIGRHADHRSPRWARVGGLRTRIYSNSLLIVMGVIWLGSWFAQSIAGHTEFNARQLDHHQAPLSWIQYVGSADFWNRTLQNWQSEFLAVGSFVLLAVYLRQRGSPESKPVGAPHGATGVEG
jgi:uncharacterized protein DUF6766